MTVFLACPIDEDVRADKLIVVVLSCLILVLGGGNYLTIDLVAGAMLLVFVPDNSCFLTTAIISTAWHLLVAMA